MMVCILAYIAIALLTPIAMGFWYAKELDNEDRIVLTVMSILWPFTLGVLIGLGVIAGCQRIICRLFNSGRNLRAKREEDV